MLGPLEVRGAAGAVDLGPPKQRAVLAALLLARGQVVSSDRLVEVVWGEDPPPSAIPSLQAYVSNLRRLLRTAGGGRHIERRHRGYVLTVDDEALDVTLFLQHAGLARAAADARRWEDALRHAEAALSIWRGPLLTELQDEAWVRVEATSLEERRAECLETQICALLARSRALEALARTGSLVDEHPFRERTRWLHLIALHRAGRTAEALAGYREHARLLAEELGLEPGRELRELHAALLRDDPALERWPAEEVAEPAVAPQGGERNLASSGGKEQGAAVVPDVHLPEHLDRLLGRDGDLRQLTALVQERRLVTVTGAAGCGKTRIGVQAARDSAADFADGVWFVDLASVDDPELVVDVVVSTIGFSTQTKGTSALALRAFVQGRRMLVVLDNCEHVLSAAADAVAAITGGRSDCVVLATSREPLGLANETLWPLGPLAVEPVASDEEPSTDVALSPAVELFIARAAAADPTLVFDERSLATVSDICRALDGVPLAVELAAARVRVATLEEIAEQVSTDASGLRRLGRGRDDHRRSVWSAIEWSHRVLSVEEQAVHRRLAVLPGRFSRGAAAAVAADGSLDAADVPEVLAQLVHRSLLVAGPADRPGGPTLFHQLATVRGHAGRALHAAGETGSAVRSRDEWVAELIASRPPLSQNGTDWYADAEDAFPTIRAVLQHQLVEEPNAQGGQILSGLSLFWYYRNLTVEGDRWLRLASTSPHVAPADALLPLMARAAHAYLRGHIDAGRRRLDRALELLASLRDVDGRDVADGSAAIAMAAHAQQDSVSVERLASAVATVARTADDSHVGLLSEVMNRMVRSPDATAESSQAPAADCAAEDASLYERALESGNVLAAWVAARVAATSAAAPEEALVWLAREARAQLALGAKDIGIYAEFCAGPTLAAGRPTEAVRLFAAGRTFLRRTGLAWPFLPTTSALMSQAEEVLGAAAFRSAWRDGEHQRVEHLLEAVVST
jgi:predicted ATPase/DNA-binding SARP family transcriptional activator